MLYDRPSTGHWGYKKEKTKIPASNGLLSNRKELIFLFHRVKQSLVVKGR